jgi:hypothetical protein
VSLPHAGASEQQSIALVSHTGPDEVPQWFAVRSVRHFGHTVSFALPFLGLVVVCQSLSDSVPIAASPRFDENFFASLLITSWFAHSDQVRYLVWTNRLR